MQHLVNEYFKAVEKNVLEDCLLIAKQRNLQHIEDLRKRNKSKLENLERLHDNLSSDDVDIENIKYVFSKNKQKIEGKVIAETEAMIESEHASKPDSSKVQLSLQLENLPGFYEGIDNFLTVDVDLVDLYPEAGGTRMPSAADYSINQQGRGQHDISTGNQSNRKNVKQIFDDDPIADNRQDGVQDPVSDMRDPGDHLGVSDDRTGKSNREKTRNYYGQLEQNITDRPQLSQNASRSRRV